MLHTKYQTTGPSGSEVEEFLIFLYFYGLNLGTLSRGHLGPWDLGFNKLGKEPLGNAIYQRTMCIKAIFGLRLRSKYESGNKSISLHDFIRPIFLVFHFSFNLNLAVQ